MTNHVSDEYGAWLGGDLPPAESAAIRDHTRACAECSGELAETVHAHCQLARAARTLRAEAPAAPARSDLPPLVIASPPPRRRSVISALAGAAAAIVIIGAGVLAGHTHTTPAPVLASGALAPVSAATSADASGEVTMTAASTQARAMTVHVTGLPPAAAGHFYEVWLFAPSTGKMLPVGVLGTTATSVTFTVPTSVTGGYSAVDISLQSNNGDPRHSADSVLRAHLTT